MLSRLVSFAVIGATACGGAYGGQPPARPNATKGGIENAGLPYTVLDARTGHQVDTNAFWDKLASERVVCVGEEHKNPHHHWVELETVRRLATKWPHFALGMEMFQRPFQGVLDDYAAKKIDQAALLSRSGWEDRWGYDYGFYGPTIAVVVEAHAALVALNASKELTKKVVHHGLESLTPAERAQLPAELKLDDKQHRAWFDALMSDMGEGDPHNPHGGGTPAEPPDPHAGSGSASPHEEPEMPSADRIYAVQVIWDETMADSAVKWLAANKDGRIVIMAGSGHCHDSAIVNRIVRRGIKEVVSVRSVIDDGQGGVAEELAKPMTDFLVVLQLPEDVKKQLKEQNAKESGE
ncbi:hypothetical protein BH11MYX1_BH11MYX1_29610 [soil metagenome]